MATLGDLLAAARRSSGGLVEHLHAADRDRMTELSDAAARAGETETAWARGAVAGFERLASEEDWATLTSRLRDSDDPGTECLVAMVDWRLRRERLPESRSGGAPR